MIRIPVTIHAAADLHGQIETRDPAIAATLRKAQDEADRAALGREYLEKIGYDPFEDDPAISTETVRQTLAEYDEIAAARA
jgi:hypothetical protein